jgi:hypothetical protein
MTDCPYCGKQTFVGAEKCDFCGMTMFIQCENKRCGEPQFFENEKCTVCGKAIKKAEKQINIIRNS